jgi:hybrid cluster-associated redox disulfide protein
MESFTADMPLRQVLTAHPKAAAVFEKHGLGCSCCFAADMETLSSVASMHDIGLDVLLNDLNALALEEESSK